MMRAKTTIYNFLFAFILFFISLSIGIVSFIIIEDYNFVDAVYMTVITVATVGFTEVHPLSVGGRIFTSLYILCNLAIFAYVISVVTKYLFEGELKLLFKNYMSDRELKSFNNHIIVCGYGRNGSRVCEELSINKKQFILIEKNPEAIKRIPEHKHINVLEGDATVDDTLIKAGVERASVIITTTPSDAENVFITLTARQLNPTIKIISRASEMKSEKKLYSAGADEVIMPDELGGMFMAQLVTKPDVIKFLDVLTGMGNIRLEEFLYEDFKEEFRNKNLRELDIIKKTGVTVIGFKDNQKGFIASPTPDTFFGKGDIIIVLGADESIGKFREVYTVL